MHAFVRLFALGTVVSALSAPAWGADGLVWKWPEGEVRRYRLAADLKLPNPIIFSNDYNKDVRVYDFAVAVDAACQSARTAGNGWDIACDITAAQLNANVASHDLNIGLEVLDQWDQKLVDDATVTFFLSADGKVKDFDIQGLNERNQRIRLVKETMRLVLQRAFAAFDLNLPKKGEGGKPWKQKGQMELYLPVITGMAGSTQLQSEVVEEDGSKVTIDTSGRGALSVLQSGQDGRLPPDTYDSVLRSRAVFDTATGNLLQRSYLVESTLTPGSGSAIGGVQQVPYVQGVELTYVADGVPMANLGPNVAKEAQ